jgi:dipeptidyl aminopeptidase/acylaminoacyl peptidase
MMFAFLLTAAALASATPPTEPCDGLEDLAGVSTPRAITLRDLAELTDFGGNEAYDFPGLFGVSPDRKQIAFITRRANPDTNSYCERLLVMPADGSAPPRELDRGGELIRSTSTIWSIAALPQGAAQPIAPSWSPDARRLAFAKKENGSTQVWIVPAAGGPALQVTHLESDVEDLRWSADGKAIIISHRPGLVVAERAITKAGLKGWLYDDSFSPMEAKRPWPRTPTPAVRDRFELATSTLTSATPEDMKVFDPNADPKRPASDLLLNGTLSARDSKGNRAWTEAGAAVFLPPTKLLTVSAKGRTSSCADNPCEHITHIWWWKPGELVFTAHQGWGLEQLALYRWKIGERKPREIFATRDLLSGCEITAVGLTCAVETSNTPRAVVSIDPETGKRHTIYEPNRGFANIRLGSIQHLHIRNAYGIDSWADLVLPPDHRAGEKHPLVLVQYRSRGFLRGGLGDDVPIQFLASRGFAVLSFERPTLYGQAVGVKTELEFRIINHKDFIDRRSVLSSMEEAVRQSIATGAVDPARMGISGFSDGTANTQFALINSTLFSVASLGACCEDQIAQPLEGGPGYELNHLEAGYPAFDDFSPKAREFWAPMSLRQNADRLSTPILAQIGDSEYTMGLDVEAAWRERGNPFELYVLPNDTHYKWQPAHRFAVYDRVSDWFTFWLMGKVDCDPAKADQYARWRKMKNAPFISSSSCLAHMPVP